MPNNMEAVLKKATVDFLGDVTKAKEFWTHCIALGIDLNSPDVQTRISRNNNAYRSLMVRYQLGFLSELVLLKTMLTD